MTEAKPPLTPKAAFPARKYWQAVVVTGVAVAMAGCVAVRSKYDVPAVPIPDKFSKPPMASIPAELVGKSMTPSVLADLSMGGSASPAGQSATRLGDALVNWWHLFGSAELDGLMDRALSNNQDLHIAAYRIAEAKARADQASAGRFPTVSIPLAVSNVAPYSGVGTVLPGQKVQNKITYEASIRGDMRADLWGERQSLFESSNLNLWSTTFERDDVQRTLVANVVSNYVDYLSLNDRIRVARETEGVLSGMENAALERMKGGDATIIDVEQMRAEVNAVRSTIPVLELQREQAIDSIALLVGSVPGMMSLSDKGLDSLSYPSVLTGVPSSLLLRRPDVRAIEAQLISADAKIDVARAEVLPPLDLTLEVGSGASALSQLFKPNAIFWNAIANLSATIFDGGKRSREVDYARSVHEEMVESYVRVIYRAIRDVEDSLAFVRKIGERLKAEEASVEAARKAWQFSMESYSSGAVDYLVVLDSERTYHSKLDDMHSIRRDRYQGLANLFLALGGGVGQAEAIPGKGARPALPGEANADNEVAASDILSMKGIDFDHQDTSNDKNNDRNQKEVWLVQLPAIYDSTLIAAAWRDLTGRYPEQMVNHRLWPRRLGHIPDGDKADRFAWYRLFIAKFSSSKEAEDFCKELSGTRCSVVSSNSSEFHDGVAVAPKFLQESKLDKTAKQAAKSEVTSHVSSVAATIPAKMNHMEDVAAKQMDLAHVQAPASNPSSVGHPAASASVEVKPSTEVKLSAEVKSSTSSTEPVPTSAAKAMTWISSNAAGSGSKASIHAATAPVAVPATTNEMPTSADQAAGATKDAVAEPVAKVPHVVYSVQLGTFKTFSRADKAAALWRVKGYHPYVYKTREANGRSWFTVRVGNFTDRLDASDLAITIEQREGSKVKPVPVKNEDAGYSPDKSSDGASSRRAR